MLYVKILKLDVLQMVMVVLILMIIVQVIKEHNHNVVNLKENNKQFIVGILIQLQLHHIV